LKSVDIIVASLGTFSYSSMEQFSGYVNHFIGLVVVSKIGLYFGVALKAQSISLALGCITVSAAELELIIL